MEMDERLWSELSVRTFENLFIYSNKAGSSTYIISVYVSVSRYMKLYLFTEGVHAKEENRFKFMEIGGWNKRILQIDEK